MPWRASPCLIVTFCDRFLDSAWVASGYKLMDCKPFESCKRYQYICSVWCVELFTFMTVDLLYWMYISLTKSKKSSYTPSIQTIGIPMRSDLTSVGIAEYISSEMVKQSQIFIVCFRMRIRKRGIWKSSSVKWLMEVVTAQVACSRFCLWAFQSQVCSHSTHHAQHQRLFNLMISRFWGYFSVSEVCCTYDNVRHVLIGHRWTWWKKNGGSSNLDCLGRR